MSGQHPIRELLTAAAAGAEVLESDLDRAAATAKEGKREHVRRRLAEMAALAVEPALETPDYDGRREPRTAALSCLACDAGAANAAAR